jgi:MerR family copper efflux transcriptional regulator
MKPMVEGVTIGQLARATGIGVETVRFYEREGLLAEPPRRRSGYRQYPVEAIAHVRFIRLAKDLGFTLKEITELLELRIDPNKSCADVRALAKAKIADVEAKIQDLTRLKSALETLARACRGQGPTSECPILDAIIEGETDRHAAG